MAKCWAYICYALYSIVGEVARANGKTFKEVAGNREAWGSVAGLFRRLVGAPLLGIDPAAVMPIMKGQREPPPLVDRQTREGFEDIGEFFEYLETLHSNGGYIEQIKALHEEVTALTKERNILHSEKETLEYQLQVGQNARREVESQLEQAENQIARLTGKHPRTRTDMDVMNDVETMRADIEEYERERVDLMSGLDAYQKRYKQATETIERLQAEIDQLKSPPQEARGASDKANNHSEPHEEE